MTERKGIISFRNREMTIIGDDLKTGDKAPEFEVLTQNWEITQGLASALGKIRIIGSLPSLETSVCDVETRRFNQEASKLSPDIAILMISADLPFTQARWCGASGIDRVEWWADGKEIGERRQAPYALIWDAPLGKHTLQVRAYDPAGNEARSPEVAVEVR